VQVLLVGKNAPIISPVAEDCALAYSPLMPVPLREWFIHEA
jgi:hypothetical protein